MVEETLFELEETGSRQDVAVSLHEVVAQLSGTGPLTFEYGGETVSVTPSDPLSFEVEVEREDDDGDEQFELEFELGWDAGATDSVEPEDESVPDSVPISFEALETAAEGGGTDEAPDAVQSKATFEVFRDRAEEWRWRLRHDNGNIIATSGEGYTTRQNAEKGLRSVVANAPGADVVDEL